MTIKMVRGTTEYEGVPYWSETSQSVIEGIDEKEGQRFIDLGFAERVPDPPPPPLQIFPDNPEKIRGKIAELEKKLSEAQAEHEALLDDDLQDVAGVVRKIENASGRVSSLRALIQKQQAKLKKAEESEEIKKEAAAVKLLEEETKKHAKEAEKILNGILSDIATLEAKAAELNELRGRVRGSYHAADAYPSRTCPLLGVLGFNVEWENDIKTIKAGISHDLSLLDVMAKKTPIELQKTFKAKRFKTAEQLTAELRERENERRKVG